MTHRTIAISSGNWSLLWLSLENLSLVGLRKVSLKALIKIIRILFSASSSDISQRLRPRVVGELKLVRLTESLLNLWDLTVLGLDLVIVLCYRNIIVLRTLFILAFEIDRFFVCKRAFTYFMTLLGLLVCCAIQAGRDCRIQIVTTLELAKLLRLHLVWGMRVVNVGWLLHAHLSPLRAKLIATVVRQVIVASGLVNEILLSVSQLTREAKFTLFKSLAGALRWDSGIVRYWRRVPFIVAPVFICKNLALLTLL